MANSTPSTMTSPTASDEYQAYNAGFMLLCAFVIFTMQTGFGLLEAGSVSAKNEVNVMYKNVADFLVGGLVFWLVGFGIAFGKEEGRTALYGSGQWAMANINPTKDGQLYAKFVFELSFATTSSTIVSGAVAERMKLLSYLVFSACQSLAYSVAVHWVWDENGWLYNMGVVDIGGTTVVHLMGGTSACVSAMMLGPRKWRYAKGNMPLPIGNGTNILLGTLFIWWGWIGLNCGSCMGLHNGRWINTSETAVITLIGSIGGGLGGIFMSVLKTQGQLFPILDVANGILAGLISITGGCSLFQPWEAFVCGCIGSLIVINCVPLLDILRIDDPVGAIAIHGLGGIWGTIAVGLFTQQDVISDLNRGLEGVFYGEGRLLGVQLLTIVVIVVWGSLCALVFIAIISKTLGFRLDEDEEFLGADFCEHGITVGLGLSEISTRDSLHSMYARFIAQKSPKEKTIFYKAIGLKVDDKALKLNKVHPSGSGSTLSSGESFHSYEVDHVHTDSLLGVSPDSVSPTPVSTQRSNTLHYVATSKTVSTQTGRKGSRKIRTPEWRIRKMERKLDALTNASKISAFGSRQRAEVINTPASSEMYY